MLLELDDFYRLALAGKSNGVKIVKAVDMAKEHLEKMAAQRDSTNRELEETKETRGEQAASTMEQASM